MSAAGRSPDRVMWLLMLLVALPPRQALAQTPATAIAIAPPDYLDTSGEVRDQRAEHQAKLLAFTRTLGADLGRSGRFRIDPIACAATPCAAADLDPTKLLAEARRMGANYLLFGGIHKESTLIQWAKMDIVEVGTGRVVFDRLLTFRGDDDAAWQHAAEFLARNILDSDAIK